MSMRIGGSEGARWASHIASIHLQIDARRLDTDMQAGADKRVIAADKAAVIESKKAKAFPRTTSLVDLTV
jgi:hypothetical protein